MAGTSKRVAIALVFAVFGALSAALFVPTNASADTNLIIGQQAVVSYANGDQVRLRQEANYEATLIAMYDEGALVTVLDGPLSDAEGMFWYQVQIDENVGYMVADFLALLNGTPLDVVAETIEEPVVEEPVVEEPVVEVPAEPDPVAVVPDVPVAGEVLAIGFVAGTNGDGVRCRVAADVAAPIIAVLPEGTQIDLTGPVFDIWQPVNCLGGGGFVAAQYVSTDASGEPEAPPVEPPAENPDEPVTVPAEPAPTEPGDVSGSAVVTGTNGDGVRCRAAADTSGNILTVLAEGASVDLTGAAQGSWQPVICAGTNGFVSTTYLGAAPATNEESGAEGVGAEVSIAALTGSTVVSGTNGDGVRCRSNAGYTGSIISVLAEGTTVSLRGAVSGEWQPVVCFGSNGFVHMSFLSSTGNGTGEEPAEDVGVGPTAITGTAIINSAPGGLNCRTSGSMSGSIITVLSHGSSVQLRGSATGGWQPVVCAGRDGFASAQYINFSGGTSGGNDGGGTSGGGNGSYAVGTSVTVTGTGGGGVRLRSAPSYSGAILGIAGEGNSATVRGGSSGEWIAVTYNGSNGFIHGDYLTAGGGGSPTNPTNPTNPGGGSSTGGMVSGDHAAVSDSLRLRYSASFSGGVAAIAPTGTVVQITGAISNGFYPVDWDGLTGYMHSDYLSKTNAALSTRGGSGTPGGSTPGGTDSGGVGGNSIVSYAMRYLGYPYVWATHGPSSFDCSGFTYWVVLNVRGRDIGAGLWTQVAAGASVSRNSLQPGDLVFFQNTFEWGLSHVGIYIGNNQFIHAENPSTGVRISDLNSQYYSSRWYGAVRL